MERYQVSLFSKGAFPLVQPFFRLRICRQDHSTLQTYQSLTQTISCLNQTWILARHPNLKFHQVPREATSSTTSIKVKGITMRRFRRWGSTTRKLQVILLVFWTLKIKVGMEEIRSRRLKRVINPFIKKTNSTCIAKIPTPYPKMSQLIRHLVE
jgi:hypothetical protein